MHYTKLLIALVSTFIFTLGQAQTQERAAAQVYNASSEADLERFSELKLDDSHPDLLDPRVGGNDQENVVKSWAGLHQMIGKFIAEKGFDWEVEKESISMYQRIYFNANGEMTHFLFNIREPQVSEKKKEEFGQLVAEFSKTHRIAYASSSQFAQCGKTKYIN